MLGSPFLEVNHNPSAFSVFAAVRQTVLEHKLRRDTLLLASSLASPVRPPDDSFEEDDDSDKRPSSIAKIVGVGLTVMLQLISESRSSDPRICRSALQALLDTLQGQAPESMKRETADLMDALFHLLLSLSTEGDRLDEDSEVSRGIRRLASFRRQRLSAGVSCATAAATCRYAVAR